MQLILITILLYLLAWGRWLRWYATRPKTLEAIRRRIEVIG